VVAGVVLLLEGFIVGKIAPSPDAMGMEPDGSLLPGPGGAGTIVSTISQLSIVFGLLGLLAGFFAHLCSKVDLASAFESFFLSLIGLVSYGLGWYVLFSCVTGAAGDLFFIRKVEALQGLGARGQTAVAAGALVVLVALFVVAFLWSARIAWPHFRAGVALNVFAMLHLVVLLLGVVSALNVKFSARYLGSGLDLTETREFSLSDPTREELGRVEGELRVLLLNLGAGGGTDREIAGRIRDLLREYEANCPAMRYRELDPFRRQEEADQALREIGADRATLRDMVTPDDPCDVLLLAYRPQRGDRGPARTKWLRLDEEFMGSSSLGTRRFKGETILTSAIREVVHVQRRVYVVQGHGELAPAGGGGGSLGDAVEALRRDNLLVETLDLPRALGVPEDADVLLVPGPRAPFQPAEAEALRRHLLRGRSVVLLLDVAGPDARATGLEDLLASYGVSPRLDHQVVSYFGQRTALGDQVAPVPFVRSGRAEFGRHPITAALERRNSEVNLNEVAPVFRAETPPEGVEAKELLYAVREVYGYKPFAARLSPGRDMNRPAPGDIVDRRIPVGVAAERKVAGTEGGGRLVVLGDADFATDRVARAYPLNLTLLGNAVTWAIRREVVAIDPKTVETEKVALRAVDRELAFWTAVAGIPLITLGVAVGVWWARRR